MKQDFQMERGSLWHLGWAAGAATVVMLAASQVGLGVTNSSSLLAAERPAPTFGTPTFGNTAAPPASLPVEVVLSHVVLTPAPWLPRAAIALPISFGRPIAPEDDVAAPPARWRHHARAVRHVPRPREDYF